MGYCVTTPEREKVRQKKLTCTQKTASREIFSYCVKTSQENRSQAPELHQGNRLTSTKIASGIPYWMGRDPIEEEGGMHLYGFVGNDPIGNFDVFGLIAGVGANIAGTAAQAVMGSCPALYSDSKEDCLACVAVTFQIGTVAILAGAVTDGITCGKLLAIPVVGGPLMVICQAASAAAGLYNVYELEKKANEVSRECDDCEPWDPNTIP